MGHATRSQVTNLRNARKVAFAAYETAIARRRDTVLIVIGLSVLFGGSVLWEIARGSTPWGPGSATLSTFWRRKRSIRKATSTLVETWRNPCPSP